MTKYKKLSANEYEVTETKEEKTIIKLDFVETDIAHKDELIAGLQQGIANLEAEKAELVTLRKELKKL